MEIPWIEFKRFLVPAGVFVLAIIGWFWLQTPSEQVLSQPTPGASKPVIMDAVITVYVTGKVSTPGVIELPIGSRVFDAIDAAGGMLISNPDLNLARVLVDGEQIDVARKTKSKSGTSSGKVNLNSATQSELESIPGIGPVMANRIIEYREQKGRFQNLAELDAVSGIGPTLMSELEKNAIVQ